MAVMTAINNRILAKMSTQNHIIFFLLLFIFLIFYGYCSGVVELLITSEK
jgi:hypothetical protein